MASLGCKRGSEGSLVTVAIIRVAVKGREETPPALQPTGFSDAPTTCGVSIQQKTPAGKQGPSEG